MNQITKPATSKIDDIIPLVQVLHDKNEALDITDPDSLMSAIGTLKGIKDLVWEIDATYWILLNQSRRDQGE